MEYEVCAVKVASNMIVIYVYPSEEDFEADRAVAVFIIPRDHPLPPPRIEEEDLEWMKKRYGNVEVITDMNRAVEIYENCKRAPKFITIPVL